MALLKRKIDSYLLQWKQNTDRFPLIVKGARQIGKTASIRQFAEENYEHIVEINFALQKQYTTIFDNGFEVDTIIKNISLINPALEYVPGKTLFFFDELQACSNCATRMADMTSFVPARSWGLTISKLSPTVLVIKKTMRCIPWTLRNFFGPKAIARTR